MFCLPSIFGCSCCMFLFCSFFPHFIYFFSSFSPLISISVCHSCLASFSPSLFQLFAAEGNDGSVDRHRCSSNTECHPSPVNHVPSASTPPPSSFHTLVENMIQKFHFIYNKWLASDWLNFKASCLTQIVVWLLCRNLFCSFLRSVCKPQINITLYLSTSHCIFFLCFLFYPHFIHTPEATLFFHLFF